MVLFTESKPQDIVETEMQSLSLNSKQGAGKPHKRDRFKFCVNSKN